MTTEIEERKPLWKRIAEAFQKLLLWIRAQVADRRKTAALLAAATAAGAAAVTGTLVYQDLADRLTSVEARPSADLAPLEHTTSDLADRVDGLRVESDRLAKLLRERPLGVQPAELTALSDKISAAAADLSALQGQAAASAEILMGDQASLASQIGTLARTTGTLASTLNDRISQVSGTATEKAAQQAAAIKAVSDALTQVRSALIALTDSVAAVSSTAEQASAAAQDAQIAADAAQATADTLAGRLAADESLLPYTAVLNQVIVNDGQTVTRDIGGINVPTAGEYVVQWAYQDGYGCNADAMKLLVDGAPVAAWAAPYGNCNQVLRTQRFALTSGQHRLAVSIGCLPPGNGACHVDVLATITRAR